MLSKLKNQEKGFTIIEVLIVLVIAGLIMLIVFLAVPALQRNSRNTQRKNDVGSILGGANEWSNNRNGDVADTATEFAEAIGNAKLGFYTTSSVFLGSGTPPTAVVTTAGSSSAVNVDTAIFYPNKKCSSATAVETGTTNRSYAVLYAVESGGSPTLQCQAS